MATQSDTRTLYVLPMLMRRIVPSNVPSPRPRTTHPCLRLAISPILLELSILAMHS